MVYYSKVHETVLVSPSVAAASAALTEYLVLATVVSVLFSDDELPEEELSDDEPPEDEPLPDEEPPPCTALGLAAIALETAKATINAKIVSNFFIVISFCKLFKSPRNGVGVTVGGGSFRRADRIFGSYNSGIGAVFR